VLYTYFPVSRNGDIVNAPTNKVFANTGLAKGDHPDCGCWVYEVDAKIYAFASRSHGNHLRIYSFTRTEGGSTGCSDADEGIHRPRGALFIKG